MPSFYCFHEPLPIYRIHNIIITEERMQVLTLRMIRCFSALQACEEDALGDLGK